MYLAAIKQNTTTRKNYSTKPKLIANVSTHRQLQLSIQLYPWPPFHLYCAAKGKRCVKQPLLELQKLAKD